METWSQDPQKYLVMHLKLRKGLQFHNAEGKIQISMLDVLKPTVIEPWQYRLLLSLDGEEQFLSVIKEVKAKFDGDFKAADVWTFLYWMIENELLDNIKGLKQKKERIPFIPELMEAVKSGDKWVKVPLQIITILVVCGCLLYGVYSSGPTVVEYFRADNDFDPIAEIDQNAQVIKSSRAPNFAEPQEIEVAAAMVKPAPIVKVVEEPAVPTLIDVLISMRQEMAACQIRRDEYYLLNDENGYSTEVARISELAKEIGQIRADIMP